MGVCWQWYKVGLDILYAKVTIRRVGQISALLRTLAGNPHFGTMIKSLGVNCFVPRAYSAVFKKMLECLVDLCPRLTRLDFLPQAYLHHNPSPLPISLSGVVLGKITHLQCDISVNFNHLAPELTHLSQTLVSLSICISPHETAPINVKPLLPRLQYLEIRCLGDHSLENLRSMLIIPALTHLTVMCNTLVELSAFEKILQLCIIHGSGLRYLHIHCPHKESEEEAVSGVLQFILDCCPHLEHVVKYPAESNSIMLSHPNIRYIDLWVRVMPDFPEYESGPEARIDWVNSQRKDRLVELVHIAKRNLPNLQLIREFDESLGNALHLPIVLPPSVDHDTYQFEYLGLFIIYMNGMLFRIDGCCWDVRGVQQEDLDSDSDDSGNDSSWESDSSRGLTDEFYEGDDWEADPATLLSVYADVVENQ